MDNLMGVVSYGLGTLVAFAFIAWLVSAIISDVTQKKHTVLRNYPVIGRLRFFFEDLGEYFRQYFFANDREEMPFNRATRAWVYRGAKDEGGVVGFGSSNNLNEPGNILFVNHAYPVLDEERLPTPALLIGEGYCQQPFEARSLVNISGMSFGAISEPAVRALSLGAKQAGCWMDTGEGGLAPYHLEGGGDVIMQIGTAKYGVRDLDGNLSPSRVRELAASVKAFEIKLSQGAKPGKGGVLPGAKVTTEIARIRGIPEGRDSISPNRHRDIADVNALLDRVAYLRELSGRPVGVKTAVGGREFANELCEAVLRRGLEYAPDFLVIDGAEGGSGAAPQTLLDHMALPIGEALPRVADSLLQANLKSRIRLVASGKLVTSARAAWAMCAGADFVNTARGFMFALGCIQAMRCHQNTCPTGITTHNKRLQRGLVVEEKYLRVANYCRNMNKEIDMIAHSCGLRHARELRREHVRMVQTANESIALKMLHPYPARQQKGSTPVV
ncbi:MAG: FMN-binding glutamate synthase family protein [Betaproteobacteria bacterium]|nr:FMN-binding glutamate synthase family protein [Betaproteobacteria bacterium]